MSVTVSQAFAAYASDASVPSQAIEDTSANILSNIESIKILAAAGNITSLKISGTANTATLAQINSVRAVFPALGETSTAKLTITDSAANILAAGNATALALATTVTLTGANLGLTVSQADTLVTGKPNFSVGVGASLGISDIATAILSGSAGVGKATVFTLTGQSNSVTVANSLILAAKPGFSLAADATLEVKGSATELLLATNSAGVGKATKVTLTGTDNTLNAANAALLVAKKGFDYAATGSPTLVINDSAANLVASTASAAVAKATTVNITGENTITAAQALTLDDKITRATGATLVVVGTAEDILKVSSTDIGKASSLNVTGTMSVLQANAIAALGKPLLTGTSLTISDTAANITAAAITSGVSASAGVKLAGMFEILPTGANTTAQADAATATKLVSLSNYLLKPGTTLTISDSAANLVADGNKTGVARASAFIVTGTTSAADATLLAAKTNFALAPGASLVVTDSADNLTNPLYIKGVNKANSLVVTGTATAVQATTLAGFKNFVPSVTNPLEVAGTVTSLVDPLNAAGLAKATKVTVTGPNTAVKAGDLAILASKPGFNVTGSSLEVSDTSANLLSSNNAASLSRATKVTMTDSATVTAAQAGTLAGMPVFTVASTKTLTIADSAANILLATSGTMAKVTIAKLIGTSNVVSVAGAAALKLLGSKFQRDPAASLTISDTADNLLNPGTALTVGSTAIKLAGKATTLTVASSTGLLAGMSITGTGIPAGTTIASIIDSTHISLSAAPTAKITAGTATATGTGNVTVAITGASTTNIVSVTQAASLKAIPTFALDTGAALVVADTAAELLTTDAAKKAGIAAATTVILKETATLFAAEATTLAAKPNFTKATGANIIVSDSAANLLLSTNAAGVAQASSYVLAAGTTNTINVEQLLAWTAKGLTLGPVNGGTAAATLTITDTATNLLALANAAANTTANTAKALPTAWTLTGTSNTLSTTDAATLIGQPGFSRAAGATLVVTGTKAELLALNNVAPAALAGATGAFSKTLTVASATGLVAGMAITGTGIPAATTIASVTGNQITLSAAPTAAISSGSATADTRTITGTAASGSRTLTVTSATGLVAGMVIAATGVPVGTTISSISGSVITLSVATTAAITSTTVATAARPLTSVATAISNALTVTTTTGLLAGMGVTGTNIPTGTTIASVVDGTHITLSAPPTAVISAANVQKSLTQALATTIQLKDPATATAAEATVLAGLGTNKFSLSPTATLVVSDTKANLFNAASASGVAKATTVKLKDPVDGTTNTATAAEATILAGKPNFALETGATLVIADNAANILSATNFKGVGIGTAFTLTGSNLFNAANVKLLAAKPGFTLDTAATMYISDTAANLLTLSSILVQNAPLLGNAKATVQLLGTTNTVSAAEATILATSSKFGFAPGASLTVQDTAANLMDRINYPINGVSANNGAGVGIASTVKVTGESLAITASQAKTLAALPNFSVNVGATLPVTDTAANLLDTTLTNINGVMVSNATGVSKATTVKLKNPVDGTSNVVTVGELNLLLAKPNFAFDADATTLTVADTAVNLKALAATTTAKNVPTAWKLKGTNSLSVAEAAALKLKPGFGLASTNTANDKLEIVDSASNLLGADSTLLALATKVTLSGTDNAVNVTEAKTLKSLTGFNRPTGVTLTVTGGSADLLDTTSSTVNGVAVTNAQGVALASTVKLSGATNTVDTTQLAALNTLQVVVNPGATLTLADTSAAILLLNDTALSRATAVKVTGTTNTVTATQLTRLVGMANSNFALATSPLATLELKDTAANIVSLNNSSLSKATTYTLIDPGTGANTVDTVNGLRLVTSKFSKATGAHLVFQDTAANLLLNTNNNILAAADSVKLLGTDNVVSVGDAVTLKSKGLTKSTDVAVTLTVKGSMNELLDATAATVNNVSVSNVDGVALANAVKLTGANEATASQAKTLAALAGGNFTLATTPTVATLVVTGNLVTDRTDADNLLNSANTDGLAKATNVKLSGTTNTGNAADAAALAALNVTRVSGATLEITDTAIALLGGASSTVLASGISLATTVKLSGANSVSVEQIKTLAVRPNFARDTGATLTVHDTASAILGATTFMSQVNDFNVSETASVALATSLSTITGFTKAASTTLTISDTAANLVAGLTSAGMGLADTFVVNDEATEAQATALAATGTKWDTGSALVVKDIAANLVAAAPLGVKSVGLDKATTVKLSGTSNIVTAAEARILEANNNFTVPAVGVSLVIADTAANLVTALGDGTMTQATGFKLAATEVATAEQAKTLKGSSKFDTTTVLIADTAANLLLPANDLGSLGTAAGTTVTLIDPQTGTNTVTASQAKTLALLHGFALETPGTTELVIADTAENLLNTTQYSAGLAKGTTLKVTDEATVARATSLAGDARLDPVLVVADIATNLLGGHSGAGLGAASAVKLIGQSNTVLAAEADQLAGETGFSLANGATLVVADTAANILRGSGTAPDVSFATAFDLSPDTALKAADAQALYALYHSKNPPAIFPKKANTALVLTDTAANILLGANSDGVHLATAFDVSATGQTITAANAQSLKDLGITRTGTMVVTDSATEIVKSINATGVAQATSFDVSGTPMTALEARGLAALSNFGTSGAAGMEVDDTAANLLMSTNATGLSKATIVKLTGTSNTVTADQAATLFSKPGFVLDGAATMLISDTAANIIGGYGLDPNLDGTNGVKLATKFQVKGTATVGEANTLAGWTDLATTAVTAHHFTASPANGLVIKGTAYDILLAANDLGRPLAAAFQVIDTTDHKTSAANASSLAGLSNFAIASGTTLVITDVASAILDPLNSVGVAKADSFSVLDTEIVHAATATQLAALMNFKLTPTTGIMVVEDTAANLLDIANGTGVGLATTVTLSGTDNAVTAIEAKTLKSLAGFNRPTGVLLTVSGTKDQLLSATTSVINGVTVSNAMGVALATTVKLTGANTADAATAKLLASKPNFTVDIAGGATLVVTGTAKSLLDTTTDVITVGSNNYSNFTGVGKATSVHLGAGTVADNTVSAAQLLALKNLSTVRDNGAYLILADSATALLSLNYATGLIPTSVELKGTTNPVTADQARQLAALPTFSVQDSATLVVTDTAEHLLLLANQTGVEKATTVKLDAGVNSVTAAEATYLAHRPNFGRVNNATLIVTGTAQELLLPANQDGVGVATTVKLTGLSNTVSTLDYTKLRAMNGFTLDGDSSVTTLEVTGSASALLALGAAPLTSAAPLANATTTKVTGFTNPVSVDQANALATMGAVIAQDGSLTVSDSYAKMIVANNPATFAPGMALAKAIKLTGANSISASGAKYLAAQAGGVISLADANATLVVTDTTDNLLNATTSVINGRTVSNATGVALASSVKLSGNNSTLTVASTTGLTAGMAIAGAGIAAGTTITAVVDATHVTLSAGATATIAGGTASAGASLALTGVASTLGTTLTVASSTGLVAGMTITGDGIAANTTIASVVDATHITLSTAPTATIATGGTATAAKAVAGVTANNNSTAVTVTSSTGLTAGMAITGTGIAANTTIAAVVDATHITLSAPTTAAISAGTASAAQALTGVASALTTTLTVASSAGLTAGMAIAGTGITAGTTIATVVDATHITLSAAPTATPGATVTAWAKALTGVASTNIVNVATAAALKTLAGSQFSVNADATLIVADTAANLLATPAALTAATKIKLATDETATAAQATQLKANAKLDLNTLVVADTAANLLSTDPLKSVGVAAASQVKLVNPVSPAVNSVLAAQALTLSKLTNFTLDNGAALIVCDSAANLLLATNAPGLTAASAVKMTGTTNSVTAAQAATLYALGATKFMVDTGNLATMVVTDTAANLLASGAGPMSKATGVKISGNANTVTAGADGALALSQMSASLVAGASLTVSDTAINLLSGTNSAGVALATTVMLKGTTNSVLASEAATLAAKPGFILAAGATLVVHGTAEALLTPANSAGVGKATAITVDAGGADILAAQAALLASKPSFSVGGTMVIADTAANLQLAANTTGVAKATSVKLMGQNNTVTAAVATTLAGLASGNSTLNSTATLVIADGAANLLSPANATGVANATTVQLTGTTNTVTAAQFQTLTGKPHFGLATGATLILADTAANLVSLDLAPVKANATTVQLTGVNSSVLAADAVKLSSMPNFLLGSASILTINDSLANIKLKLAELEAAAVKGQISSISLTDRTISLTDTEYFNSTNLRGKINSASKANLALSLTLSGTSTNLNNATDLLLANVSSISASDATSGVTLDLSKQLEALTLVGGASADTIKGGAGADVIKGGAGADLLTGGATGVNTYDYTTLSDSLITGYDTITDFKTSDKIKLDHAIAGTFYIPTTAAAATGNLTFDLSTALSTSNFVAKGAAFVTLTGTGGGQYLVLNDGNDGFDSTYDAVVKVVLASPTATLDGTNLNLALTNVAAAQSITGTAGNDTFYGFLGADTIDGGGGSSDTIVLTATSDSLNAISLVTDATLRDARIVNIEAIDASSAADAVTITLSGQSEGFTITGGSGDDIITGASGNDSIFGGAGNDTINGFVGVDTVDGGAGADTLVLSASSSTLTSALDSQLVNVEAIVSTSTLSAGVLINLGSQKEGFSITGGSGADTLTGGLGNDTFKGFAGAYVIDGGSGTNTIVLSTASDATKLSAAITGAGGDAKLTNVQAIDASAIATGATITLTGQTEGFSITGGSGNDVLTGGSGNDTFIGFVGNDTITGGDGTADTIVLTSTSDALNLATNAQIVSVEAINASTATSNVEINLALQTLAAEGFSITLGSGADTITGGSGNDSISGGDGNDTIKGFVGADTIDGGAGTDTIVLTATSTGLNDISAVTDATLRDARLVGVEAVSAAGAGSTTHVKIDLTGQTEGFSISGGAGNDTLIGGSGADSISGGDGNDTINGFVGADTVVGGIGNDTIVLTATSDELNLAGADNARLVGVEAVSVTGSANVTITLTGQTEGFSITGGAGNDTITGGSGADSISGGLGDDTINGFVGADTVVGGGGTDTIVLTATSNDLNSAADNQIAAVKAVSAANATAGVLINLALQTTITEGFTITGGAGADTLIGGADNDSIFGGVGNDTINGLVGTDTVNGGDGVDTIVLTATSLDLNAATNDQIVNVEAVSAATATAGVLINLALQTATTEGFSITGGALNDTITGGSGNDSIFGGAGDDTINGFVGADTVNGGDGSDTLVLTGTIATAFNTAASTDARLTGVETIDASAITGVTLTLSGQTEGFTIIGGAGADSLTGGAGNDAFTGFAGADTINGGNGADTIVLTETSTGLNAISALTDAIVRDARLVGVEAISAAGAGSTTHVTINLTGQTEGFSITGGAGNDSLTGGAGADSISGGIGNDTINGFAGADTINGGLGTDTLVLTANSTDLNTAGGTDARLSGVEVIDASLVAGGALITLSGQTEGFTITGGAGNDSLTGGAGNDSISGGAGADRIFGFVGDDTVDGGSGSEVDTLVLTATSTSLNNATNGQLLNVEAVSAATATAGVLINLAAQNESFTLTGSIGADSLTGSTAADSINGGSGNDMIYGFVGADTVDGGLGTDTLFLSASSTDFNAAAADNARIVGVEAISAVDATTGVTINLAAQTEAFSITGGVGADTITGGSAADNISAGAGDDTVNGFVGADTINGGDGVDTIVLTATSLDLNTAGATDTRLAGVEAINASTNTTGVIITMGGQTEGFSLTGGTGADKFTGGQGADSISGGAGNDLINGFIGADTINGGDGVDTIIMTATSLTLNGANNAQLDNVEAIIVGAATTGVSISVTNQTEGFSLTGGGLADTLTGGAGNDTIKGGVGADSLTGGLGVNTYDYANLKDSLVTAYDTIADFKATDRIAYIPVGAAGAFNTATRASSGIVANDITAALNSTNFVANGATLVTLTGNGGGQYLVLNDATAGFSSTTDAVVKIVGTAPVAANISLTVNGTTNADNLVGGAGADTISASDGNDTITGFAGADTIDGGLGADTIVLTATSLDLNAATNDQIVNVEAISAAAATAGVLVNLALQTTTTEGFSITGGSGADTITGGSGADSISGGDGADMIKGGAGADSLTGGLGVNTFDYTTFTDSLVNGFDTISDFKSGDQIKLANAVAAGNIKTASMTGTGNLSSDLSTALTSTNFIAAGATLVTVSGTGAGQYLVLNDGTAAFDAARDAVVKISATAVTSSNFTV